VTRSGPSWPSLAKAGPETEPPVSSSGLLGRHRRTEDRIERALECVDHAWAVFDAADRLDACNEAYRALLSPGLPEKLIGWRYAELLEVWLGELEFSSEEQRIQFRAERLRERTAARARFDVRTRGGLSLRVTERRNPGGGSTSTVLDRTEDERLMGELRAALQASRAAGAAKSEFLCSMSHELRTPLNSVLGFAQLLQRDTREPLPDRHRARVAQILQGGEHLVHIIDDLLDLSRIEAGRIPISVERVDVGGVLEQLRATLEPLALPLGVCVQLEAPRSPLQITADPARFLQILMNFGSNAIKYNRSNGSLCMSISAAHPGRVRVTVSDTGLGIASEACARLFEPFYRAGQERGAIPGTGMGLAISKRLAELMHGAVGFSSVPLQGSQFWVDLPAAVES
jgi:signal transduction histidine kinase